MPYTLIQQINSQHAHIKFDGQFQGKWVTWDTHFLTICSYAEQESIETKAKQFIDVQPSISNTFKLTVALDIPEINASSIRKMIIMIRQYKNLSTSRHEFG